MILMCSPAPSFAAGLNASLPPERSSRLHFSANPTEAEIFGARVFDEPLIPMGGRPAPEETRALASALDAYSQRATSDDCSSLAGFLEAFPESVWKGSLLLHLGVEYYHYGYFSKAIEAWEHAWEEAQRVSDGPARTQADRALGELARMYSRVGRMSDLEQLLDTTKDRDLTGPATQLVHAARGALWMMKNKPDYSFSCGPSALDRILLRLEPEKAGNPLLLEYKSSSKGFCLSKVAELSARLGMNYQMAYRQPGAAFIVPAVVHWKVDHYAALVERNGDRILEQDYTFHNSIWMTTNAIEHEASGYFLVPPGALPSGWRVVSPVEAQAVWGKGFVGGTDPDDTSGYDTSCGGSSCTQCQPCQGNGAKSGGMATYSMHTMLVSLTFNDTPVGYTPPIGPPVYFGVVYNQMEANQPAVFSYCNLGPKWDCSWLSYITDNPTSPAADVALYVDGGGTLNFTGFNAGTQSYQAEVMSHSVLVKTSGSSYEQQFPDGSRSEFAQSDGSTGSSRRIFLTQIIDPRGNAVQLNYDSQLRITSIVDALGQATALLYTNTNFPSAITSITDPFGRAAYLQYNSSGLLSQITDVLGLTSQFTYGTNEFVNALTTPYGTTTFAAGLTNGTTYLVATDPVGGSELLEYYLNSIGPASYPAALVPHGLSTFNLFLDARNSLFWDKKAFADGAGDYTKATIYHWLHNTPNNMECTGILESMKKPLESRIWYNYPGQPTNGSSPFYLDAAEAGASAKPSVMARLLDDGSEQISYFSYNVLGQLTNFIDPMGRSFSYVYASNNVDLLQIAMTHNGKYEALGSFTYNSQHLPLTITDTAGQTTARSYNSAGQISSTTNPKGETTSYSYSNSYLTVITGPLQNANDVVAFTYDLLGRVRTAADTEGYTLTYSYDAMDRITSIAYPDNTSGELVYSNLDLAAGRDRLGRWTTNTYNAVRQLIQSRDPLGRITTFDWCKCGALSGVIDPMGRTTTWDYDVQSRPVAKHFADGSTVTYVYEQTTSQLLFQYDQQGQQTFYEYYPDNSLKRISYPNAILATPAASYTYDPDYTRLLTMQDGAGTTTYSYYPIAPAPVLGAGQLSAVVGPIPNSTMTYQYDELGRVSRQALNGVAQTVVYDVLGRPTTASNALGAFQYAYAGASARLTSKIYPNGQTNLYSYYDNVGDERLLQVQHFYPNGSLLSAFGYSYNAAGQINGWTNQWDTLPTRVLVPSYDAANQLTNAASIAGFSALTNYAYTYDAAGNRTMAQSNSASTQFEYNSLNQLTSATAGPTNSATYQWDAAGRLVAINQGGHRSQIVYDGRGRRVQIIESDNGTITANNYFVWCGGTLCEERDATGATVVRRFFPQGEIVAGAGGSTNVFYTRDHLGSVREAVDSGGSLQARYDYDPYGRQTVLSENVASSFAFTGLFQHRPSGLNFALYRGLNPQAGRWLNRDPLGESGGGNLYQYSGSDPVNSVDRSGLIVFGFQGSVEAETAVGPLPGVAGTGLAVQATAGVGVSADNSVVGVVGSVAIAAGVGSRNPWGIGLAALIVGADRLQAAIRGTTPEFRIGGFISYGVGVPLLPPCYTPTMYGTGYIQKGGSVSGAAVVGNSAGYGLGAFGSGNATHFSDLAGPFVTTNVNTPGGSGSIGVDPNNPDTHLFSFSPGSWGTTVGTSASIYTTQTPFTFEF